MRRGPRKLGRKRKETQYSMPLSALLYAIFLLLVVSEFYRANNNFKFRNLSSVGNGYVFRNCPYVMRALDAPLVRR
jgi:hypothetical protein